ncbi:MBL fold metallo-hydrolase [Zophobihabitans entericus]|uniref:Carbon-phosphorus lyase n=1 Tax=Zophobihabitans entericus TaxID=1635327 RepID=A0A6G9I9Y5_9GAMM|nr:MBL fold metallo-hydrolase [Zophobihabitans entericus]QIQ21045.1 carbon-phosphorus lyase [Zophobihabitans entericus]
MKLQFLGTAASEGIPNPFCKCEICEKTRVVKGKDVRTRSSFLIDDVLQIDIAPEFSYQVMRENVDVTKIKDLLFTHTHPDHFNVGDLFSRMVDFGFNITHPLHIYGNDRAINGCLDVLPGYSPERFQFHLSVPYVTITTSAGYTITPLLANHAKWEFCFVYVIEKDGKRMLYGHDSGYFPELTWDWLKGKYLDLAIFECTYGYRQNDRTNNHMSIETVLSTHKRMLDEKIFDHKTQVLTSHHSHSCGFMHDELVEIFKPHNIEVAYDGLTKTI